MQSTSAYSYTGRTIDSKKPSAPRATFGRSERTNAKKLTSERDIMKVIVGGKEGNGPASYFPTTEEGGKVKFSSNIENDMKYASVTQHLFRHQTLLLAKALEKDRKIQSITICILKMIEAISMMQI